jgi:hypothetical protein
MKRTLMIAFAACTLALQPMYMQAQAEKNNVVEGEVAPVTVSEVTSTIIHVVNANNQKLEVYNLTGMVVATYRIDSADKTINHNLQRGCYLLKIGKVVRKVTIR